MKLINLAFLLLIILFVACTPVQTPTSVPSELPAANLPNPASAYCEQQGYRLEIRSAEDGSQTGYCIFPDYSECEEWAYYRGECKSPEERGRDLSQIPTAMPIDPSLYQGWWTYTHPEYGFSLMLPEDWAVADVTTAFSEMNDHFLTLLPTYASDRENIRIGFRLEGEEVDLWPSGVGEGQFVEQGELVIASEPARRMLLVCPTGEVTQINYQENAGQPTLLRGYMEFSFTFSYGDHCQAGLSLEGKMQRTGEMIISSLQVP